mmetsp:Transcript_26473/g.55948  ORF Transcript_26473/g.55948 Transcript_26473/m.55948 type:complete len:105 (+) Transcript_26473:49-363(+)
MVLLCVLFFGNYYEKRRQQAFPRTCISQGLIGDQTRKMKVLKYLQHNEHRYQALITNPENLLPLHLHLCLNLPCMVWVKSIALSLTADHKNPIDSQDCAQCRVG